MSITDSLKKPIRPIVNGDENNYHRVLDRVHDILNGGISLGTFVNPGNINAQIVNVTFGAANTDFAVPHTLNRVPTGYISTFQSDFAIFVVGVTAWTVNNIYLKSNVANVIVHFLIF